MKYLEKIRHISQRDAISIIENRNLEAFMEVRSDREKNRRQRRWLALVIGSILLLAGCSQEPDKARVPTAYTIEEERGLPDVLLQAIQENREREIRMTFEDGDDLYLVRGYGKQKTGGYSITVEECEEDSDTLYFTTRLIGPKEEVRQKEPSYPYLVVRVAATEKKVEIR